MGVEDEVGARGVHQAVGVLTVQRGFCRPACAVVEPGMNFGEGERGLHGERIHTRERRRVRGVERARLG